MEAEASRQTRLLSRGQRGVRDPMDPAGDRRFGTLRSGESPAAGSIGSRGPRGSGRGGAEERRSGVRQREEGPGGVSENSGRG